MMGFTAFSPVFYPVGIRKSVKERVNSIPTAVISFASGANGASNVVAGSCGWVQCLCAALPSRAWE